jgi:hypothetical protein
VVAHYGPRVLHVTVNGVCAFFNKFNFFINMHSVNLQFFLNILDILDIKVWSLEKKLSVRDSILG